ncbi:AfsR/SARP family transcriptional regulator [Actinosynnema sp. ALI-1.44]|uniref:AfsR/SARP family transcriptional regulator n=1 Tax=Actinosynnema sp. ALI-1.44 TaxID=1933779 RepID=UPI00192D0395|nr:BTAD domain-containing putative transcriptional regulator [Actinosynnema sp. ALI-1.44]
MRFEVLGEVRAWRAEKPVDVGHSRQTSVLAALLFDANRLVSADQLLDRVWGHHPPPTARGTLSTYLTRLRQALAPVPIERRTGGYQITVEPGALDLDRFDDLLARARAAQDDRLAARTYELAFDLWRGEPLPGLDTPWANDTRSLLHRRRYAAELDRTDVLLRLGEHAELVAELMTRTARHPLDERLAGQVILALYRTGRQADAVSHYQAFQQLLADELGTDPGRSLRDLHHQILADDQIVLAPEHSRSRPPRQLPAPPRAFTGRRPELDKLSARTGSGASTLVIHAIGGGGGIGKTSLALHWAHQHADRFPDGQLFANLRGFDPSGTPAAPSTVLRGFLNALGVKEIPGDLDAQAGLYRTIVADRRMLVVLDNAADTTQVGPLLPGSASVTTLVTSRHPLTGLVVTHGAHALPLDVLSDDEAYELLRGQLGDERLLVEPDAVAELVKHCGGLPLAVSIVAARAVVSPDMPLAELAAQLRSHTTRLDGLDTGDADVNLRAVLALSYRAVSADARQLAWLLGVAPGPDISFAAVGALAGDDAAALLRELESVHLVSQFTPGRYRMHDLVRLDAAEQAAAALTEKALRRLIDFYLRTGQVADRLLDPRRPPFTISGDVLAEPHALRDEADATAWMTAEHTCLLAAQELAAECGWHAQAWEMSFVTDTWHSRQGQHADHLTALRTAVTAADAAADPAPRARLHANLGQVAARAALVDESVRHFERAITLADEVGDLVMQAHAHQGLAECWGGQGDNERALDHACQSLKFYRAAGSREGEASALNQLGWVEALLGKYDDARRHCLAALAIVGIDGMASGQIHDSLGFIDEQSGRLPEAIDWYRQAIAIFEAHGDDYNAATTLIQLGRANLAHGHTAAAVTAWQSALDICRIQRRTGEADRLRQRLSELGA